MGNGVGRGPIGTDLNNPSIDSGTLQRSSTLPPGPIGLAEFAAQTASKIKPKQKIFDVINRKAKIEAAKSLAAELPKKADDVIFVEIGAGDLKASLLFAKNSGVKVIAVDPALPPAAAVQELERLGGEYVRGTAADLEPRSADHVFQYLPWQIEGAGSHVAGGTYRLIDDTARILRPNGAAHFVTESKLTAEYLLKEASEKGFRAVRTESKAGIAAQGASGAGVPNFSADTSVWLINIYK